jgi:cysteine desulfurase
MLPSPVLRAMSCPEEELSSSLRFSLSHRNTEEEMDRAAAVIVASVLRLRTDESDD